MFKFDKREDNDYRAHFANDILEMVYIKYNGNLDLALNEVEKFDAYLDSHVRNIYETIDSQIPLIAYLNLKKDGADNWGFTNDEYQAAIDRTINACHEYYKKE